MHNEQATLIIKKVWSRGGVCAAEINRMGNERTLLSFILHTPDWWNMW